MPLQNNPDCRLLGINQDIDDIHAYIGEEAASEGSLEAPSAPSSEAHPTTRAWWPAWPHTKESQKASSPPANGYTTPDKTKKAHVIPPSTLIEPPSTALLPPIDAVPSLSHIPSSHSISEMEIRDLVGGAKPNNMGTTIITKQDASPPLSSSSSGASTTEDLTLSLPHLAGLMLSSPAQPNLEISSTPLPSLIPTPTTTTEEEIPTLPSATIADLYAETTISSKEEDSELSTHGPVDQMLLPYLTDDYFQGAEITTSLSHQETADEQGWLELEPTPIDNPTMDNSITFANDTMTDFSNTAITIKAEDNYPEVHQNAAFHLEDGNNKDNDDYQGDLTENEKLGLLSIEFPSFSKQELQMALDGSNGKLDDAICLLKSFQEEDNAGYSNSTNTSNAITADSAIFQHQPHSVDNYYSEFNTPTSQLGALTPEYKANPGQPEIYYERPADEITSQMEELSNKFPSIARESLMVALELTSFDLEAAKVILNEQTGAVEEPIFSNLDPLPPPLPELSTSPEKTLTLTKTTPSKERIASIAEASRRRVPPNIPDHVRNQQIYDEERSRAGRLRTAYLQLDSQAKHAAERGDYQMATDLNRRANELRQEYYKASKNCATRIAMRVNRGRGQLGFMQVDLHGLHLEEALEKVRLGLDQLPLISPGGVVMRYITGRGAHSGEEGAKIKPAVIALLEQRGVHFAEGVGYIDTIIDGKLINQQDKRYN